MKILVCAYTCSPNGEGERFGGGEDILGWNVVLQLARFHDVHVLGHTRNRRSVQEWLESHSTPNIRFHFFELGSCLRVLHKIQGGIQLYAFLWQVKAYFVARKLHKKYHFELFHHVTYANDWMASYVGALLPVHYVRGPGGGAHRTPKRFLKLYGLKGRIWEVIRSTGQYLFRHDPFFILGHEKAKALLLCNREALDAIPVRWKNKTHLFAVCGVSSHDLNLEYNPKTTDTFKILTAGKLLKIKGFELAIRSFAVFFDKHPNSSLTIAGDGPELDRLRSLSQSLGLDHVVGFDKWVPRNKLLRLMAESDVFLFPSLRDGGGAVVIESMAMKTPVVCLDISGPAMHVTDQTGIKIPALDPGQSISDIATALDRLYTDVSFRQRLGIESRRRVEAEYNWDRVGERLNEVYSKILSGIQG